MSDADVRKFNERAAHYENDWLGRTFHQQVQRLTLDLAARIAPNPSAILDVGCGTGSLLRQAAERFPYATRTGVDPAERMIAVATEADPSARLIVAPAERLPFNDNEFDLVVSTNSFHNWPDHRAGITEIGRVLRPGGTLVLVDPFAIGLLRPWAALIGKRNRMRTKPDVEAMLAESGLRDPQWQPITGFVHAVTASSRR
ncbi:MAG TPA: methyltransferase domain-containing protein [Pseudonocardiaceae bacterium]